MMHFDAPDVRCDIFQIFMYILASYDNICAFDSAFEGIGEFTRGITGHYVEAETNKKDKT